MPSYYFAHVIYFTQNALLSCSPANPGFICDVQVTQHYFPNYLFTPSVNIAVSSLSSESNLKELSYI